MWEGIVSNGFGSIVGSGFLAAYALALGASNLHVGVLAAIPFLTQPIQILMIAVVEHVRRRKAIAVTAWGMAQLLWLPIAAIPFILGTPSAGAISMLLGLMLMRGILGAITNSAWNGWVRDLVPQELLGRFFARRIALANLVAMVFGLGSALFVDAWQRWAAPEEAVLGYTFSLLAGALTLGLATPIFMALMPEPQMQPPPLPKRPLSSILAEPFRDKNFQRLVRFLFLWGLSLNLAVPFFAVYMLQRLGMPLTSVIFLSVLGQGANIAFMRAWGPMVDRFGSKAVLSLSVSLYLLVILGWTFTTMPEGYFLTVPLLVILHLFAGVASAGVGLTTGTIGMKLAPEGRSTAYLAVAALATNLGSGLGPLLGGQFADFFDVRSLSLTFSWIDPTRSLNVPTLHLTGFDFLFALVFIMGLATLNALNGLKEEGEATREEVLDALVAPMRVLSRPLSSAPALGVLGHLPYSYLRRFPLPGLDVAVGVTAYQIAEIARGATIAAVRGRRTAAQIAEAVDYALTGILDITEVTTGYGAEVARQAMRGTLQALGEMTLDVGQVANQAAKGVARAMSNRQVDAMDALWGAGYGAVEGAIEAGADPGAAVLETIAAARELAQETGIEEEKAVARVTAAALEAAEARGPETLAKVIASLPVKETAE
jgi:MFS family permease